MSDQPASEQFDLTAGMDFDVEPAAIESLADDLEQAESFDAENADDETLAEFSAALKRLENAAEDARKDVFEDELDDRTDEGEQVGPVVKRSGKNTWVQDDEAALAAVSEAGIDPLEVAKVSISGLRDALGQEADEYIGSSEYIYFRRQE